MNAPRPGAPVRGSASGRPIMAALDLLGRRGALRILWELRAGPLTFRDLQEACETNPGLLNTRLKELRTVRIVTHAEGGYRLTPEGEALARALRPLSRWADEWAAAVASAGHDERPGLIVPDPAHRESVRPLRRVTNDIG